MSGSMYIWKLCPNKKFLNVDLKSNNVADKIRRGFFNTWNEITQEDGYSVKTREQLYSLKHIMQTHRYDEAYTYLKKKIKKHRD